jgi:NTP pyrophosphatase (non-canonical NTP hydrolase)
MKYELTHAELVSALAKPAEEIMAGITPEELHILHMTFGVCGETGELLDQIKKHVFYKKPIDRENLVEELGDIEFYLEGVRASFGITREETVQQNIDKLNKRYSSGKFSNQQAQERADKNE